MTYFSNLPKIYYDFNIGNNNESRIIRDISTNIRFKKELLSSITLFDEYDIMDGETPDIISEKIYGSPHYHWVIMLLNERFDYINDFPMTTRQFQQHLKDVYGTGNELKTHHYVDSNGYILTSTETYYDPYRQDTRIICTLTNGKTIVTAGTSGAFSDIMNMSDREFQVAGVGISTYDMVRVIRFIDNTSFEMSMAANLSGAPVTTEIQFIPRINPMRTAKAVSNHEYEFERNEAKRKIKLLHPSMLSTVMEQFKVMINA